MKVSIVIILCKYIYILYIIGEGTRASESKNPALPISQGNEEVGVGTTLVEHCYSPWIILFQMTSPVSTVGTDDPSFSESMYRSIMSNNQHSTFRIQE